MSCLPSALKSFSRSFFVLRKFLLHSEVLLQLANKKRRMQSSSAPAAQATSALDAAFAGTAFTAQSPHGDSGLQYGIPHGSAAVHAAVAESKPPDIPMGVAEEKTKEKRPKREGGWSGSPAAKGLNASAGAATPVPALR